MENKLEAKDLINVGIFTAIYYVFFLRQHRSSLNQLPFLSY